MKTLRDMIPFVIAALLVGMPARAQDTAAELDEIFSWVTPTEPGCVVGVAHHGKVVAIRAYGLADLERNVPLIPETLFDIGSLQKQFVAAAVLLLVSDGRVSLTDDIRTYFPELPDYGQIITVDHLLTHTSGLRDWVPLLKLSSEENDDALTAILRQRGLNFAPGEAWSYSNSGYVLLKELVARTTGMPFSAFARQRLFEPLGMQATSYVENPQPNLANVALAYEKGDDGWRQDILVGNQRGGGALFSTVGDLLIWNEALTDARLGEFVTVKIQEPARLANGRELGYARGLFLDANRGGKVVWHTGSAGGYKGLLSRFPEQGLSIAILSNAGENADRKISGRRIFDLLVPAADVPEAGADTPVANDAAGIDVSGRAGLFFDEATGDPLRLVVNEGRLRIAGGPALVALAADRFRNPDGDLGFRSQDEFELRFLSADGFELTSREGETTRYRRARPYAPTAADLAAFAGRFASEELRAVLEIAPGDDGLVVRLNDTQEFAFAPVDPDTFQRGMMTLRFRRDSEGKVVALDYSNPVLRNVSFDLRRRK